MSSIQSVTVWRLYTTSDGCGHGPGVSTPMVFYSKDAAIKKMENLPGVRMGVKEPLKNGDNPTCNGYKAVPEEWDKSDAVKRIAEFEEQLTQYNLILERLNELSN